MNHKLGLWEKIKAYKLTINVITCILLLVCIGIASMIYVHTYKNSGGVSGLMLALSTSLFASLVCIIAETFIRFKNRVNDQLLEGLHEFGIEDLHFNKERLMIGLLENCHTELYLSGYRLILLDHLSKNLTKAAGQCKEIKVLVSPPWGESFKKVYGDNEKVADNYFRVFHALYRGVDVSERKITIRFIDKPLFSDTYKVDRCLITGPYLHNKTSEDNRVSASDFFTYTIAHESRLYQLVEEENNTLWAEASGELSKDKFMRAYQKVRNNDFNEAGKLKELKGAFDLFSNSQNACSTIHS